MNTVNCKYCGIPGVHPGTKKCIDGVECELRCEVAELKGYLHNIDECLDEFSSGLCSLPPKATEADVYPAVQLAINTLRIALANEQKAKRTLLEELEELKAGPSICSNDTCQMHCGYGHAQGCDAIKLFLSDHGGDKYDAPRGMAASVAGINSRMAQLERELTTPLEQNLLKEIKDKLFILECHIFGF